MRIDKVMIPLTRMLRYLRWMRFNKVLNPLTRISSSLATYQFLREQLYWKSHLFLMERHFCSAHTVIDRFGSSAASEESVVLCCVVCLWVGGWVY